MKFPLLKLQNTKYPKKAVCPQCKQGKVFEPHSMAIFEGGAMFMDRKRVNGGLHRQMDGFAKIMWHGAHSAGIGQNREVYTSVDFARDCRGGQFEAYFCSTTCLRAFFNSWVDALEAKVKKEQKRKAKTRTKPAF
ncbi:MAG TPA: hypothetical protein VL527_04925 [Dongiaceae bacterium]|jgi:hypothetical protein|nr:hypothetical protein [Dongiaceae bacterium]